jgi:lipopolysaccharide/colanic/teichoic acid biosynthesis glycosyltransferase
MEQISQQRTRSATSSSASDAIYGGLRRLFDLVAAVVLLIVFAPVMMVIGLATFLDSGVPIIYRSARLGRRGHPIIVLKFRTMRDRSHHHLAELLTADEELRLEYSVTRKLRDDPRRTQVGTFLRKTSLDELPQLWNVLRGEMSLIGPRPYFAHELAGRPEAEELLSIRPGMTGLWQVNGRSNRTFAERISLEVRYVRRRGPVLDFKILVLTARAVLTGRGAY